MPPSLPAHATQLMPRSGSVGRSMATHCSFPGPAECSVPLSRHPSIFRFSFLLIDPQTSCFLERTRLGAQLSDHFGRPRKKAHPSLLVQVQVLELPEHAPRA